LDLIEWQRRQRAVDRHLDQSTGFAPVSAIGRNFVVAPNTEAFGAECFGYAPIPVIPEKEPQD